MLPIRDVMLTKIMWEVGNGPKNLAASNSFYNKKMKKVWEVRSHAFVPHYTPATNPGYCYTEWEF